MSLLIVYVHKTFFVKIIDAPTENSGNEICKFSLDRSNLGCLITTVVSMVEINEILHTHSIQFITVD